MMEVFVFISSDTDCMDLDTRSRQCCVVNYFSESSDLSTRLPTRALRTEISKCSKNDA